MRSRGAVSRWRPKLSDYDIELLPIPLPPTSLPLPIPAQFMTANVIGDVNGGPDIIIYTDCKGYDTREEV